MHMRAFALAATMLAALGCTPSPPAPGEASRRHAEMEARDTIPRPAAPLWSRDGLEAQPRLEELRRRVPPELGYRPGSTEWHAVEAERIEPLRGMTFASPAAAGLAMAAALGWDESLGSDTWEWTVRVWLEDGGRAYVAVLAWGIKDDSIAGQDLRLRLREEADGWGIATVEQRFHCARGVTDGRLCV
jgi:hypothetical protein